MMEAPFTGPKPNPGPGSPDKEVAAACPQTGLRALVAIALAAVTVHSRHLLRSPQLSF